MTKDYKKISLNMPIQLLNDIDLMSKTHYSSRTEYIKRVLMDSVKNDQKILKKKSGGRIGGHKTAASFNCY